MSSKKKREKKAQSHRGSVVFWCYGVWGSLPGSKIKHLLVRDQTYMIPIPEDNNIPRAVLSAAKELLIGGLIGWKICYTMRELEEMALGVSVPPVSGTIKVLPKPAGVGNSRN